MQDFNDLDPFSLSRLLQGAAERYHAFSKSLSAHEAIHHPFGHQMFPGQSHFEWAQALSESDPMRTALLRWIYYLTDARIHVPSQSYDTDLEYRAKHPVTRPVSDMLSLSELRREALSGKRGSPEAFWRARGEFEGHLSEHRVNIAVHKQEVAERMGRIILRDFWNPLAGGASVRALAERILAETSDAAEHHHGSGWSQLVEAGLARSSNAGWPARLAPDTLYELLFERELYRGVILDLGAMPERLCPASFPRAAIQLGRALSKALVAGDLPFVMSFDPHEGSQEEAGALLMLWVTSPAFLLKKLQLSRTQTQDMSRGLASAKLAHLRLAAARALMGDASLVGRDHILGEFKRVAFLLCRDELPQTAALARFRVPENSATQLIALLSAATLEADLVEEYDEDWYLNPRAGEYLRERWRRLLARQFSVERCERGLEIYKTRFVH